MFNGNAQANRRMVINLRFGQSFMINQYQKSL